MKLIFALCTALLLGCLPQASAQQQSSETCNALESLPDSDSLGECMRDEQCLTLSCSQGTSLTIFPCETPILINFRVAPFNLSMNTSVTVNIPTGDRSAIRVTVEQIPEGIRLGANMQISILPATPIFATTDIPLQCPPPTTTAFVETTDPTTTETIEGSADEGSTGDDMEATTDDDMSTDSSPSTKVFTGLIVATTLVGTLLRLS